MKPALRALSLGPTMQHTKSMRAMAQWVCVRACSERPTDRADGSYVLGSDVLGSDALPLPHAPDAALCSRPPTLSLPGPML